MQFESTKQITHKNRKQKNKNLITSPPQENESDDNNNKTINEVKKKTVSKRGEGK